MQGFDLDNKIMTAHLDNSRYGSREQLPRTFILAQAREVRWFGFRIIATLRCQRSLSDAGEGRSRYQPHQ